MDYDLESLARQGLENFNRGDMDALRDMMDAQDYVYEESGDVRVEGREAPPSTGSGSGAPHSLT